MAIIVSKAYWLIIDKYGFAIIGISNHESSFWCKSFSFKSIFFLNNFSNYHHKICTYTSYKAKVLLWWKFFIRKIYNNWFHSSFFFLLFSFNIHISLIHHWTLMSVDVFFFEEIIDCLTWAYLLLLDVYQHILVVYWFERKKWLCQNLTTKCVTNVFF